MCVAPMLDLQHTEKGSRVIFDFIEWDEHNLDHATRRLTASEIEQVVWNADAVREHQRPRSRVVLLDH